MEFKFDKKLKKEFGNGSKAVKPIKSKELIDGVVYSQKEVVIENRWHYFFVFPVLFLIFIAVVISLVQLQIFSYEEYAKRSQNNQFEIAQIKPNRGLIVDRNGKKLAENVPAISVYITTSEYRKTNLSLDREKLSESLSKLEQIVGKGELFGDSKVGLMDRVESVWNGYNDSEKAWVQKVEVVSGMSNEVAVKIKTNQSQLPGIVVENGSKRFYPLGDSMAHILGYTGNVFYEDLIELDYISFNDVIGRSGLEKVYDKELFGQTGKEAFERDSLGNIIEGGKSQIEAASSGATLHLSIDSQAQRVFYKFLKRGVNRYDAKGGSVILEDISTGEVLVMASYPSFDNNKFVGGISQKEYNAILKSGSNPLLNRGIGAQIPPGSTFKTVVASAALDAGAVTKDTVYVSRRGYTFSNDKPFQEYNNNAYGALNLLSAISVSSNIYFCEVIRNWDMDKLVPYLERFGIGKQTGIDLLGEGSGRLPSPKNKIELAKTTSPWLDAVWYPEGDSCNSVIGQGITTVTPLQMVNWVSAIANGGTLQTPHIGTMLEYPDGSVRRLEWNPARSKVVKDSALSIVREGMWESVNGSRRVIIPLSNMKPEVAAKTGTAEFGRVNSKGEYQHTHAWVTGFYPYKSPKYAFVVLLEDGGASNNSAQIAREFIDWWNANWK